MVGLAGTPDGPGVRDWANRDGGNVTPPGPYKPVCYFSCSDNVEVVPKNDGTYAVNYSVDQPGDYTMTIKYGGQPVRDGFYKFTVTP